MLSKIKEIIEAYAVKMNPTPEQKATAQIRISICMGCEKWKQNSLGINYCSECGCATAGKIFTQTELQPCPLGKWTV